MIIEMKARSHRSIRIRIRIRTVPSSRDVAMGNKSSNMIVNEAQLTGVLGHVQHESDNESTIDQGDRESESHYENDAAAASPVQVPRMAFMEHQQQPNKQYVESMNSKQILQQLNKHQINMSPAGRARNSSSKYKQQLHQTQTPLSNFTTDQLLNADKELAVQIFEIYDRDKDGRLSSKELHRFAHHLCCRVMEDVAVHIASLQPKDMPQEKVQNQILAERFLVLPAKKLTAMQADPDPDSTLVHCMMIFLRRRMGVSREIKLTRTLFAIKWNKIALELFSRIKNTSELADSKCTVQ